MDEILSVQDAYKRAINQFISGEKNYSNLEYRQLLDYCVQNGAADAEYLKYAFEYSEAVSKGTELSLDGLKNAANFGVAAAQYDLGLHYFYGEFIEQDTFLGLFWMEQAGENGYKEACRTLARLYTKHSKVKSNELRAEFWKAKYEGEPYAETHSLMPLIRRDLENDLPKQSDENEIKFDHVFATKFEIVPQETVITADPNGDMVVNAGPGTGKTYTLIKRIAYLVKEYGVSPNNIAVFSFTRAVVKELKNRLEKEFADDSATFLNVDIRTFHSKAYEALLAVNVENLFDDWKVRDLSISKIAYDDCMLYGGELFQLHPEIISGWEYVIIDEIQDINQAKAYFVLQLIEACKKNHIHYMLLGDSCQAIYDYLNKKDNSQNINITSTEFYTNIIYGAMENTKFFSFDINQNYRSSEKVKVQALPVRKAILEENIENLQGEIYSYQKNLQEIDYSQLAEFVAQHPDKKICILERRNVDTIFVSTQLRKKGLSNICVISKDPYAYPQWIGHVFGGYMQDTISMELFVERLVEIGTEKESAYKYWEEINKAVKFDSEIISMTSFIYKLLSHELDEIILDEQMDAENVIVSNIHRAKGLEFDYVLLDDHYMRSILKLHENEEIMQEARVLYVGMTRAKEETLNLKNTVAARLRKPSWAERFCAYHKDGNEASRLEYIELLIDKNWSDYGPESFVVPNMMETQTVINSLNKDNPITLELDEESKRYAIVTGGHVIGWMGKRFQQGVKKTTKGNYPKKFDELYVGDIYTYIGQPNGYYPEYERKLKEYSPEYGKYRIWNYVSIIGLPHAVYDN